MKKIYLLWVDGGFYEDYWRTVVGVFECPILAEKAKLNCIKERDYIRMIPKPDSDEVSEWEQQQYKNIVQCWVMEYETNAMIEEFVNYKKV